MPTNLTQLPLEVRNRIYDFVFPWEKVVPKISPTKCRSLGPETSSWGAAQDPNKILALLLVDHQISAEYTTDFYSKHTFTGQPSDLVAFLQGIGDRRNLVRAVEVQEAEIFTEALYKQSMPFLSRILSELPVLRSLKLNMSKANFKPAQSTLSHFGISQLANRVTIKIRNSYSMPLVKRGSRYDRRINVWTRAADGLSWEHERGTEESSDL